MKVDPVLYTGLPEPKQILIRMGRKENDPEIIIEAVCRYLGIPRELLTSRSRKRELVEGRMIAIGLILQVNPAFGLKKIGRLFGGRDHSTALYNRELFNTLYKSDKPFTKKVQEVLKYV